MQKEIEFALLSFIEMQKSSFTFDNILSFLKKLKVHITSEEIKAFLDSMPFLYQQDESTYCSKAIIFDNACFSILPTKKEIDEGYLIIGHRTLPFTNIALFPYDLNFYLAKKPIQKMVKALPNSEIEKHYELFGDDHLMQIIEMDPANMDTDPETIMNPELYSTIITVLDMKKFYEKFNFRYGDRIICKIVDWYSGLVNIAPYSLLKENPFEVSEAEQIKKIWAELFENNLACVINEHGVLTDIYEQLLFAIMMDQKYLCSPWYNSIEEVLENSTRFELQPFGIESRIWFKEEPIIAIKKWDSIFTLVPLSQMNRETCGFSKCISLNLNDFIIQAYIKDAIFNNETDIQFLMNRIIPDFIPIKSEDLSNVMLKLEHKSAIIRKDYSKFADFPIAQIRHDALDILSGIIILAHEIRLSTIEPATLPQQPLIIMMHLVDHISKLLCVYLNHQDNSDEELNSMQNSVQGMKMSFDENKEILMGELNARHNNLTISFSSEEQ